MWTVLPAYSVFLCVKSLVEVYFVQAILKIFLWISYILRWKLWSHSMIQMDRNGNIHSLEIQMILKHSGFIIFINDFIFIILKCSKLVS